jgi:hypothetical protein
MIRLGLSATVAVALVASAGSAGAARVAIAAPTITSIELRANDLAYDRVSDTLYASVPGSAGPPLGNRIVAIDPDTGALGPSVFVGSEPNDLAVSVDGQFLYVGLDGAAAIRRVDLPSFTAGLQFSLGADPSTGPLFAEDIEVVPGDPSSVAVSLRNVGFSPRHEGVAVFQDGELLPAETPGHTGSNRITFDSALPLIWPPVARLYGYNNETTEFGFRRMRVGPDGVAVDDVTQQLVSGFGVDIEVHAGRVYATTGRAVDPSGPTIVGTYSPVSGGPVEAVAEKDRVYFVSASELRGFDLDEFLFLGSTPIPGASGSPRALVEMGDGDLAFNTTGDRVFFARFGAQPAAGQGPAVASGS